MGDSLSQATLTFLAPHSFNLTWPFADERYGSYYNASDYPVVKLLREPIYVEVSIRHRTDPSLGLHLHQCWATPGMSPLLQPQWPMLVNG